MQIKACTSPCITLLQGMCCACRRIALVRCVVEMAGRLHASRQSLSRPTSAPEPQGPAAEDLNEAFLQVCCTLYTEHLAGTEQPLDVGTIARVLPDTRTVSLILARAAQAAQLCALMTIKRIKDA